MSSQLVVPQLGESISEAIIGRWLKAVGETIEADEPVVDLETDKVNVQIPAPSAGVLSEQKFAEGSTVKVGDIIGLIDAGSTKKQAVEAAPAKGAKTTVKKEPAVETTVSEPEPAAAATAPRSTKSTRAASPAKRKQMREQGLEELEEELEDRKQGEPGGAEPNSASEQAARGEQPAAKPSAPKPSRVPGPDEPEEIVAMSPLRRTIARRLVESQKEAAILTTFNEVDMNPIMEARQRYQEEFIKQHAVKLGFMSFFVKAAIAALKEFPGVNAEIRDEKIVYKKYYHVGIAVGSGRGLVVPVLRHADRLGFAEIEKQIAELAGRAQKNTLTLDELSGGTFTITNGGIYGSMMSTPLLNPPQTGILGMHNIVKRAVVIDDQVQVRPMMYIALSYDHRVVDGREAVQFLIGIKRRCEAPERMLFEI